jgi:hypothetical protein
MCSVFLDILERRNKKKKESDWLNEEEKIERERKIND